ncbi:MAG: DNA topoisomerase IV subunit A [Alphaproteobacteria bacterium]|nr:DNA topoisomerase IV subunit A [Alphaproteobacteria bacterium]MCL2504853.1 DNA topoisomerase IV subunit A [Alphaproteobacteria bacterium]
MVKNTDNSQENDTVQQDTTNTTLRTALSERYLSYALSTIMDRALPDVRDGLKPVHRRLIYAMRGLKLEPSLPPKKSARVVGDVIGKFHPHGDTAVYDAMVRLAQDFSQRYPLVEGQGNFGNIDGDSAAAMRYTEARLTSIALLLLEGIDENAVDFRQTYDNSDEEPVVMPAGFPNLIANGSNGIAVGMATSIPPHNLSEVCDALKYLINTPNAGTEKLMSFIAGPDFPTGGELVESKESIISAYNTGKGSFRVRARWHKEDLKQGMWQIVVTEIPYQVQKSRLIEKIAELIQARKLPLLEDIMDESAEDIRIVLTPKSRTADPKIFMETLFRQCDLESKFSLNMNVLDKNCVPRVMSLKEVLKAYLEHRQEVLVRKSTYKLQQIEARLEILEGYLTAFLNLDKVIKIIRTQDEPKPVLMKTFSLTENQADAILNMRLRSLRKLEEMQIKGEQKELSQKRLELKKLLKDENLRWAYIEQEITELKKQYGKNTKLGARRTTISDAQVMTEVPIEAVVEKENITIILSNKGWIRAIRGHVAEDAEIRNSLKYKEGDEAGFVLNAQTTDKILVFATNGKVYTVSCDKLPPGRGFGEPIRLMIELSGDEDIIGVYVYETEKKFIIASNEGKGFIVKSEDLIAQTKHGKQILNAGEKYAARACAPVEGDTIAVIGNNRKLLLFPANELPEMTKGKGITLQKYSGGELSDVKTFNLADGLTWKSGERTRTETDIRAWKGTRAGTGKMAPNGFNRNNKFS